MLTSQITSPTASDFVWASASSRSQVPSRRHRTNRSYAVRHGPYRSGRSRHGAPVRSFHTMALITVRWSRHCFPRRPFPGSSGAIRAHATSVSSPRPTIAPSTA